MTQPENSPLRFGIIADIHYALDRNPSAAIQAAEGIGECTAHWQEGGMDFVVQLGDLIDGESEEAERNLAAVRALLARYHGKMVHLPGNHCLAIPPDRFFPLMGIDAPYYSFELKGIRFIVLHGMDVSVLSEPDCEEDRQMLSHYRDRLQAHFYCGAIGIRQQAWLISELDAARDRAEPVIILCHFPLLEETTDPKHGLLWNHEAISAIVCRYGNVRACLSGHYHPGAYACRNGIHFVVLPAFANRTEPPSGFSCGTVEIGNNRILVQSSTGSILYDLDFR